MAFPRDGLAQAFREDIRLQQFVLTGVTPTGRVLGTGSYGSVEVVTYQHITCAGKKLHEALIEQGNEGVERIVGKYLQECQLMASLHHPNITQFLGLCFLPRTRLPLLVMERLEASLDDLLENMPNLPLSLKRSVLEDVASGLLYLHDRQPPVIHRDLTSKNVLLTSSLVAKITDMGNSRIADMRPGQMARTMSALPGTLVYMPPEAHDDRHRYGTSLDIFSFGHLALFVLIQAFPGDLLPSTYPNPDNIGEVRGRTELERRGRYIDNMEAEMGRLHPALVQLVKQCLHNVPDQRPSTDVLLTTLQRMRVEVEGEYGGPVKLDMVRVKQAKEIRMHERRLTQLQERHEAELAEKNRELEGVARVLEERDRHVQELQANNEHMAQEMARKDQEIAIKEGRVQQLQCEVEVNNEHMAQEMASKDQEIAVKDGRVQQLQHEMEELRADLQLRETRLREELQSKEAEISRLREELRKCQEGAVRKVETSQVPLQLPLDLQFRWRRGPDMPFQMSGYVQAVKVEGTVYVGGGFYTVRASANERIVMAYNTVSGKWAELPQYRARDFAMTAVNSQLTLVGGMEGGNFSQVLGVWRSESKEWTHPYPDMSIPRSRCSAFTYKTWLIVAGGEGGNYGELSSVEVMDISTKQWYTGPPLPAGPGFARSRLRTAIVGDLCYLISSLNKGNRIYKASLPDLVSQLDTEERSDIWKEECKHTCHNSTPLCVQGSLLVVGGNNDATPLSWIHLYQGGARVKVGDLPTPRWNCACVMFSDRELLVAGGCDTTIGLKRVDIGTIEYY